MQEIIIGLNDKDFVSGMIKSLKTVDEFGEKVDDLNKKAKENTKARIVENEKVSSSIKAMTIQTNQLATAQSKANESQAKGLIATLVEMRKQSKQLDELDGKIQAQEKKYIDLQSKKNELSANDKERIEEVNLELEAQAEVIQNLKGEYNKTADSFDKNQGKVQAGFGKFVNFAKLGALAVVGAVAAIGGGLLKLAFENDAVADKFDKVKEKGEEAFAKIGEILAPVLFTVLQFAEVAIDAFSRLTKNFNSDIGVSIGATLKGLAGGISAFVSNVKTAFQVGAINASNLGKSFKLAGLEIAGLFSDSSKRKAEILRKEIADQSKEAKLLKENYISVTGAFKEMREKGNKELKALADGGLFSARKATEAQKKAVADLTKEYERLFKELKSNLQAENLEALDPISRLQEQQKIAIANLEKQKVALINAATKLDKGNISEIEANYSELANLINDRFGNEISRLISSTFGNEFIPNLFKQGQEDKARAEEQAKILATDLVEIFAKVYGVELEKGLIKVEPPTLDIPAAEFNTQEFEQGLLDQLDVVGQNIQGAIQGVLDNEVVNASIEFFDNIAGSLGSVYESQIGQIDLVIAKAEEKVDAIENSLERELELQKLGLANNADALQEDYDTQLEILEEANAKRLVIEEKQARLSLIQDTIQQGSSLLTASANIFSTFSAIPVVGVPLAIAAIGTMFAFFAKARIEAKKLVDQTFLYTGARKVGDSFGYADKGGSDDKRSHGYSVVNRATGEDTGVVIGGSEMINKQSVSEKHGDALWYLNQNEEAFKNVNLLNLFKGFVEVDERPALKQNAKSLKGSLTLVNQTKKEKIFTAEEMDIALNKMASKLITYFEKRPSAVPISDSTKSIKYQTAYNKTQLDL